jgi:hypothetical protein
MTEELPPLVFLDMAAKAVDYQDWEWVKAHAISGAAINSIVAHARTLERLAQAMKFLRSIIEQCPEHIPITLLHEVKAFLAKHEPDIVPVDPDEEALMGILRLWSGSSWTATEFQRHADWPATLAQFKAELAGRK